MLIPVLLLPWGRTKAEHNDEAERSTSSAEVTYIDSVIAESSSDMQVWWYSGVKERKVQGVTTFVINHQRWLMARDYGDVQLGCRQNLDLLRVEN